MAEPTSRMDRAIALLRAVHDSTVVSGPWGDDDGVTEALVCDDCGGTPAGDLHHSDCVIKAIEDFLAEPVHSDDDWDVLTREALSIVLGWFSVAIGDEPVSSKVAAGLDWARAIANRDEAALENARARWTTTLLDPNETRVADWTCVCGHTVLGIGPKRTYDQHVYEVGVHQAKCDAWIKLSKDED